MFQPSQQDVRRFFCATRAKQRDGAPLTPMEALAADWIAEHPEYDAELADEAAALAAVQPVWQAVLGWFGADRLLWGSDWPHLNLQPLPDAAALLQDLRRALPQPALQQAVLVDNPQRLIAMLESQPGQTFNAARAERDTRRLAATGDYQGEFLWHNSSEDDEHIAAYGVGGSPACWMQVGYATGYVSTLFGRMIVFREVDCRSSGAAHCRVVGKSAELWDDPEQDLFYLNAQDFVGTPPATLPTSMPAGAQGKARTPNLGVPPGKATASSDAGTAAPATAPSRAGAAGRWTPRPASAPAKLRHAARA